jgi:DNA-binding transcriptional regulator YhcF (GntR family)
MNLRVNQSSPLTIREQIKRQVRAQIESGLMEVGAALPSARNLADLLNVNRNTVTQAYKELALEGRLEVIVGSGTFVRPGFRSDKAPVLKAIFDKALEEAMKLDFPEAEIIDSFFDYLAAYRSDKESPRQVLVVDCNRGAIDYICSRLNKEFGVKSEGALIQELEADRDRVRKLAMGMDLIICVFNHIQELKDLLPENAAEVLAVLLRPHASVLNELLRIPTGSRIGYVCANQRSTETLFNSSYFSGGKELRRVLVGFEDRKRFRTAIRKCQIAFVTGFIFDRVKKIMPQNGCRLIRVDIDLDESSWEMIRRSLCG